MSIFFATWVRGYGGTPWPPMFVLLAQNLHQIDVLDDYGFV